MLLFSEIIDAIIDLKLDPTQVGVYASQGQIYPVVDYRLSKNELHLINFGSNDYIDDIVTIQELTSYLDKERLLLDEVVVLAESFEIADNKVLLF